jgi:hypothetical protein
MAKIEVLGFLVPRDLYLELTNVHGLGDLEAILLIIENHGG